MSYITVTFPHDINSYDSLLIHESSTLCHKYFSTSQCRHVQITSFILRYIFLKINLHPETLWYTVFLFYYRYGRAQMTHRPKYRPSNIMLSRLGLAIPTCISWSHTWDAIYAASHLELVDQSVVTLIAIDRISHAPYFSVDCMMSLPYNNPK